MAPPQDRGVHVAQIFVPELKELLVARDFVESKKILKSISAIDLADVWKEFTPTEQTLLFRLLNDRQAITLFQELETPEQTHLLKSLADAELQHMLGDIPPEDAARLFNRLP